MLAAASTEDDKVAVEDIFGRDGSRGVIDAF